MKEMDVEESYEDWLYRYKFRWFKTDTKVVYQPHREPLWRGSSVFTIYQLYLSWDDTKLLDTFRSFDIDDYSPKVTRFIGKLQQRRYTIQRLERSKDVDDIFEKLRRYCPSVNYVYNCREEDRDPRAKELAIGIDAIYSELRRDLYIPCECYDVLGSELRLSSIDDCDEEVHKIWNSRTSVLAQDVVQHL